MIILSVLCAIAGWELGRFIWPKIGRALARAARAIKGRYQQRKDHKVIPRFDTSKRCASCNNEVDNSAMQINMVIPTLGHLRDIPVTINICQECQDAQAIY